MVVRRGGRLIPADRHPLVVFLLAWAAFVGFGGAAALLLAHPRPPGWLLPWWLDLVWYVLLGGGAVAVLTGTFWRDAITGVLVARGGYWPLGAGGLIYALLLAVTGRTREAVIIGGFSVACVIRAVMIHKDVRAELVE